MGKCKVHLFYNLHLSMEQQSATVVIITVFVLSIHINNTFWGMFHHIHCELKMRLTN